MANHRSFSIAGAGVLFYTGTSLYKSIQMTIHRPSSNVQLLQSSVLYKVCYAQTACVHYWITPTGQITSAMLQGQPNASSPTPPAPSQARSLPAFPFHFPFAPWPLTTHNHNTPFHVKACMLSTPITLFLQVSFLALLPLTHRGPCSQPHPHTHACCLVRVRSHGHSCGHPPAARFLSALHACCLIPVRSHGHSCGHLPASCFLFALLRPSVEHTGNTRGNARGNTQGSTGVAFYLQSFILLWRTQATPEVMPEVILKEIPE